MQHSYINDCYQCIINKDIDLFKVFIKILFRYVAYKIKYYQWRSNLNNIVSTKHNQCTVVISIAE